MPTRKNIIDTNLLETVKKAGEQLRKEYEKKLESQIDCEFLTRRNYSFQGQNLHITKELDVESSEQLTNYQNLIEKDLTILEKHYNFKALEKVVLQPTEKAFESDFFELLKNSMKLNLDAPKYWAFIKIQKL